MKSNHLEDVSSHFKFGENWSSFSEVVNDERIKHAEQSLIKLLGESGLKDKTFLDIGCGSGLFSLAAIRLGAKRVVSIDIDPDCVETAKRLLKLHAPNAQCEVYLLSVFDLQGKLDEIGKFDIVFSWGVLHHTGSMLKAISLAKEAMKDKQSKFAVALYSETRCCTSWKHIKAFYAHTNKMMQGVIKYFYTASLIIKLTINSLLLKDNVLKHIWEYKKKRGMSFMHDVHDWLGGYPYESISDAEFCKFAQSQNLHIERKFAIEKTPLGFFGSGCNEYVLRQS